MYYWSFCENSMRKIPWKSCFITSLSRSLSLSISLCVLSLLLSLWYCGNKVTVTIKCYFYERWLDRHFISPYSFQGPIFYLAICTALVHFYPINLKKNIHSCKSLLLLLSAPEVTWLHVSYSADKLVQQYWSQKIQNHRLNQYSKIMFSDKVPHE